LILRWMAFPYTTQKVTQPRAWRGYVG
jgi:hypothetical protein